MRASSAIPGNPWPHDMVVEVADSPHAILDLLWLREACGLRPTGVDLRDLDHQPMQTHRQCHLQTKTGHNVAVGPRPAKLTREYFRRCR